MMTRRKRNDQKCFTKSGFKTLTENIPYEHSDNDEWD